MSEGAKLTLARGVVVAASLVALALERAPEPRPVTLTREMAASLNHYASPRCELDAQAGDDLREVLLRVRSCVQQGY